MDEFGAFLRDLRGKMTFREAAEKSGVSHAYIRYLEIGKRPGTNTPINPSPEMLKGLAKAYNHSFKDLMVRAGYSYDDIESEESDFEMTQLEKDKQYALELFNKITDPEKKKAAFEVLKGLAGEK